MNLVIDIGNTRMKVAFFDQGELLDQLILTEEELKKLLSSNDWEGIIVSCVGKLPNLDFGNALLFDQNTAIPVSLNYKTVHTLGVDRIAAAVGASVLYANTNCLVIDAGTCVTYDFVSSEGVYEGGAISPGYAMRLKAMNNFTQSLPLLPQVTETPVAGKSTDECMLSGALYGLTYEMTGYITYYESLFPNLKVLLCGGDAKTFESKLKQPIFVQPNLVLIGLNRILETHNAK